MSELMTVTLGDDTFEYVPLDDRQNHHCFTLMGVEWDMDKVYRLVAGREPSFTTSVIETGHWIGDAPGEKTRERDGEMHRAIGMIGVTWKRLEENPEQFDPRVPMIGADMLLNDGTTGHMIIDGWHRLARARQLGMETMLVVMLTTDEELKCRTARSYKPRRKRKAKEVTA